MSLEIIAVTNHQKERDVKFSLHETLDLIRFLVIVGNAGVNRYHL